MILDKLIDLVEFLSKWACLFLNFFKSSSSITMDILFVITQKPSLRIIKDFSQFYIIVILSDLNTNLVKDQLFFPRPFFPLLQENAKMNLINNIHRRVVEYQIRQLKNELEKFEE